MIMKKTSQLENEILIVMQKNGRSVSLAELKTRRLTRSAEKGALMRARERHEGPAPNFEKIFSSDSKRKIL